jgi:hypothetical protein
MDDRHTQATFAQPAIISAILLSNAWQRAAMKVQHAEKSGSNPKPLCGSCQRWRLASAIASGLLRNWWAEPQIRTLPRSAGRNRFCKSPRDMWIYEEKTGGSFAIIKKLAIKFKNIAQKRNSLPLNYSPILQRAQMLGS